MNFGSSSSPSLFGMDRDKQREFNNSIEKSGLVLVRTEVEAAEFVKKRTYDHDGVFYEPSELPSIKVELDRKGLAEFQAWADFTLHQIDDQIYSRYAFDPQWTTWLKTRTVKTMDDYRQIARGEYDELARGMKLNYKIHRLKSPDDVDAVLEQASIGFHFSFSVSCGLQGTNLRYHFQNRW